MKQLTCLLMIGCTVGEVSPPGDDPQDPITQPTTPQIRSVVGGGFHALGTTMGISGRALMARQLDKQTYLSIAVSGLDASMSYIAHLHCRSVPLSGRRSL